MLTLVPQLFRTIFVTGGALIILCLFLLWMLPLILYRKIVELICWATAPNVHKILHPLKNIFWQESTGKDSRVLNIVVWAVVEGHLESERVETIIDSVTKHRNSKNELTFPEFQQTIKSYGGYNFWVWDKNFNPKNHYRILGPKSDVPAIAEGNSRFFCDQSGLKDTLSNLYSKPFDPQRSPWEVVIIPHYYDESPEEGFPREKTVALLRIHHVLGDGYSFLQLFQSHVCQGGAKPVVDPRAAAFSFKPSPWQTAALPLRMAYDLGQFLGNLPYDSNKWKMPFKKLKREYFTVFGPEIPVETVKKIKNYYQVNFQTVIIAVIGAGLKSLMMGGGSLVKDVPEEISAFLPLPLPNRPESQGFEYHATGFFVGIPIKESDPRQRLFKSFSSLKKAISTVSVSHLHIAALAGRIPGLSRISDCSRTSFETVQSLSIFPGLDGGITLGGKQILSAGFALNPSSRGNAGLAISSLTCFGRVRIVLTIDQGLIEASEVECGSFERSINQEIQDLLSDMGKKIDTVVNVM